MTDTAYRKGLAGESRAAEYLQKRGMVLLEKRYRSPFGEIDLVMRDGETLVFVEVKARGTGRRGTGLMAVGRRKQAKLVKTALQYLGQRGWGGPVRFDTVELTADGIQHIVNAFEASEY